MSIRPSRAEARMVEPHHRGQAGRVPKNPIPEEPLPRWSPKASRLAARLRPEAMNRWPVLHRGPEGPRLPGPPPRSPKRPLWLGRKARGAGALRSLPSTTVPNLQGNRIRRGWNQGVRERPPQRHPKVADTRVLGSYRFRRTGLAVHSPETPNLWGRSQTDPM